MSTHHPKYQNYNRHRAGLSVRRTRHADYKNDKPADQPYSDHQAHNLTNQMALNLSLSGQARPWIHQVSCNGYVMIRVMQSHEIE